MTLVRMTHHQRGELLVPDRAVARHKAQGWKVKRKPRQPNTEQAEAPEDTSGAFLSPDTEGE